jgi:hypothetical protein
MPRPTHIPFDARRSCGALYENCYGLGKAALDLEAAKLEGSAAKMQFAAEAIAEMASRARVLAATLERQLALHRRRSPEAGVR